MSLFARGSDGLERVRDAASALKRWRPAGQTKLRIAREHIERLVGPIGPRPENPPPESRLRGLQEAGDQGTDDEFIDRVAFRRRPGAGQRKSFNAPPRPARPPLGTPPVSRDRTKNQDGHLRRLERWFPELRWLFRRLHRLELTGRPWLLGAHRTALTHRRKLIWAFVVGACLLMPPS